MQKSEAIKSFGSSRHLASALGISPQAVHQWPDVISEPRASHIREAIRAKIAFMESLLV
jgi:DNA-binding transcriptional regulator YdaS (Cro superfamily)